MQDLIITAKPEFDIANPPSNEIRLFVFKIVVSPIFDGIIISCIILNIVVMGIVTEDMTTTREIVLGYINLFFTIVFIIEATLKIFGQGHQYFYSSWNQFDFAIVCSSLFDILMDILGNDLIKFLSTGPQLARVLRVLRVSRLFKLMKTESLNGINRIITTIIFSFPALMNVLA